jgi:3-oxoacyl-[acyl-carrier-protein] synthase I
MMKRVVITGMGVVSPVGSGLGDFRSSIFAGNSGIKKIAELEELRFNCQIGGIPDVSKSEYLSTLEKYNLAETGSTLRYALLAGLEAWNDARLPLPEFNSPEIDADTGVIIGSGLGSMDTIANKLIPLVKDSKHRRIKSSMVEELLFSSSGAYLSGIITAGNMTTANSNACATGTEAVFLGFDHIRRGNAKRMVAGSTEGYSPYYWALFDSLRVTAANYNEAPEKGCRPMSASACGMVPAAGAGIMVLEELESAMARNAKIYAEISGGFLNAGGQRNGGTMTAPNPASVIHCIQSALKDATVTVNDIDCISGHLSSTMADVIEIRNWKTALKREKTNFPYINSLKSMTGHCLGAAGAIETIASVLELHEQFIHPSINCQDVHPEIEEMIDVNKIPGTAIMNANLNYIARASFGFGDVNACLILKKYKQ